MDTTTGNEHLSAALIALGGAGLAGVSVRIESDSAAKGLRITVDGKVA